MPRALDDPKLCSGNELDKTMGAVDGNPGVFASPDDEEGQVELRVQVLHLVRVRLVGLRNLAIEGSLPVSVEPWRDQGVHRGR